MSNWGKMRSGRAARLLELDYTGSGTVATTNLGPQTLQVRVASDVRGYLSVVTTTITTSSGGVATVEILPNVSAEYLGARPGEVLSFSSSSTSSGSILITEMT